MACAAAACLLVVSPGGAATERTSRAPDSVRVADRILISERGIRIIHSDRSAAGSPGVASRDRGKSGGVIDLDHGRIRITAAPDDSQGARRSHLRTMPGVVIVGDEESGLVRVFSDAEVRRGERIEGDVVAVFGSVLVEGEVAGNVVAVFGSVRLAPGAMVDGDAVAIGGMLDQATGATVNGESVSLGFLPFHWGAPTLPAILGAVLVCWLISVFAGWILSVLFPTRLLRIATTVSTRSAASLALGLLSAPLLVIAIVLLMVTVIGIPLAFLLPLVYVLTVWTGQLASTYLLGCRLMHRRLGEGQPLVPMLAGTLFVASFFVLGSLLAGPAGALRTVALFFDLLGALLIFGLSVIGAGAVLLSRAGARPREIQLERSGPALVSPGAAGAPPPAAAVPPGTPAG